MLGFEIGLMMKVEPAVFAVESGIGGEPRDVLKSASAIDS